MVFVVTCFDYESFGGGVDWSWKVWRRRG